MVGLIEADPLSGSQVRRRLDQENRETTDGWTRLHSDVELETVLDGIVPGQPLRVVAEVRSDYNMDAQLFFTEQDEPVGYVPDWLAKLLAFRMRPRRWIRG